MASTPEVHLQRQGATLALLSIVLCMGSASCSFLPRFHHKKARVFVPPPLVAKPIPPPQPNPTLPAPEDVVVHASVDLPDAGSLPQLEAPPVPPPKRPVAAAPKPAPPPTQPSIAEPVPAPKLGQIYTVAEEREYNRTIEESLDRVRKALVTVSGKSLTAEQNQIAESIRTFQRQAESAREQDLVTAVSLARRADLLAKDLMARLR